MVATAPVCRNCGHTIPKDIERSLVPGEWTCRSYRLCEQRRSKATTGTNFGGWGVQKPRRR